MQKLTKEILVAAIAGFEVQKQTIDAQIAELRAMLPGGAPVAAAESGAPKTKRRKFSAASRRRIAAAQQARWSKIKGEAPEAPKPRRRMSAASRKKMAEAAKKRWVAKKAA